MNKLNAKYIQKEEKKMRKEKKKPVSMTFHHQFNIDDKRMLP